MFSRATMGSSKLRLAISGPSGSGKTYTSLSVAKHLGARVALIDTEHGSASKYAKEFEFDVAELSPPYHPKKYAEAIRASESDYDVLIIDSLTHAWSGDGGLLDIVQDVAKRQRSASTFRAWREVTPMHNKLIGVILSARVHIIATMRAKQSYELDRDDDGRVKVSKLGLAPQQREGTEYEFDIHAEIDTEHNLCISKTRCPALTDRVIRRPGKEFAAELSDWLRSTPVGVDTGEIELEEEGGKSTTAIRMDQ